MSKSKSILNRAIGQQVYIFLPFGYVYEGRLSRDGHGYMVANKECTAWSKFTHKDVEAVNKGTGRAFALTGTNNPLLHRL